MRPLRTTLDARRSGDDAPPRWLLLACLLIVGGLLGFSANLAKISASIGLPPLALLTWSIVGTTLILTTITGLAGRLPRPTVRIAEYSLLSAVLGVVGPQLLLFAAVEEVGASFVALSIAFPPLFTYLGALLLRLESLAPLRATGVLLALGGAALLAALKLALPSAPVGWILATLLAPVILAAGNLYRTARWPRDTRPEQLVPGMLIVSSLLLLLVGSVTDISLVVPLDRPTPFLLIAVQTAAFSVQYLLFFFLQKWGGPVYLSLLGSVAAVVGVPVAVLLLGEAPLRGLPYAATMIAGGILLLLRGGGESQPRDARPAMTLPPPSPEAAGRLHHGARPRPWVLLSGRPASRSEGTLDSPCRIP